jgi:hypothetical protein
MGKIANRYDVTDCKSPDDIPDDHGVPGMVWHAFSAVTSYTTHTEGRNEATRSLRALTGSQDRYMSALIEAAGMVS